ncbi:MAG: 3-oxoacyl-[acyl-carrier-protein] synthase III C-terminal domain-containing protein, partial [Candidatus Eisenbacteria bacterium]|nr:3-oxoacyl-[acyl-carrier-protein] synthase III C-terminal domain-containing protein [Candidatus Eisenbacteria bacterium]
YTVRNSSAASDVYKRQLHYQHESTAENLVVSSLFADGSAAALIGCCEAPGGGSGSGRRAPLRLRRFATWTDPRYLDRMGFHLTDRGFRMHLAADVPALVETLAAEAARALFDGSGLVPEEIGAWLVHPGGVRILEAVERGLHLPDSALGLSRSILARYGNLSSATSLFLLDAHRHREVGEEKSASQTGAGVLLALGPGLTVEGAIFEG